MPCLFIRSRLTPRPIRKRPFVSSEKLATDCDFHQDDCIIISRPKCSDRLALPTDGETEIYELATAVPTKLPMGKHDADGQDRTTRLGDT